MKTVSNSILYLASALVFSLQNRSHHSFPGGRHGAPMTLPLSTAQHREAADTCMVTGLPLARNPWTWHRTSESQVTTRTRVMGALGVTSGEALAQHRVTNCHTGPPPTGLAACPLVPPSQGNQGSTVSDKVIPTTSPRLTGREISLLHVPACPTQSGHTEHFTHVLVPLRRHTSPE